MRGGRKEPKLSDRSSTMEQIGRELREVYRRPERLTRRLRALVRRFGMKSMLKPAAHYRAMAAECFQWASQAKTREARAPLLQLGQIWLNTASRLDGRPATRTARPDELAKTTNWTG
jgi:hypothetical protein